VPTRPQAINTQNVKNWFYDQLSMPIDLLIDIKPTRSHYYQETWLPADTIANKHHPFG